MTAFANAPAPAGLIFQKICPSSPIALPPTILEAMYGESKPLLDAPQTGLHMVRLAIPCRSSSKLLARNQGVLQLSGLNRGAPQLDQIGQIVTQVIGSIFPQRVGRTTPPRGSEERLGGGTRVEEVVENDGAIVVSGRGGDGSNAAALPPGGVTPRAPRRGNSNYTEGTSSPRMSGRCNHQVCLHRSRARYPFFPQGRLPHQ